jgi:hypothetical protein
LRVAGGDGRLNAEELDERVGAALTARTYGELAALVSDLPAAPTRSSSSSAFSRPSPPATRNCSTIMSRSSCEARKLLRAATSPDCPRAPASSAMRKP